MHFGMKNTLKNNRNHTLKQAIIYKEANLKTFQDEKKVFKAEASVQSRSKLERYIKKLACIY